MFPLLVALVAGCAAPQPQEAPPPPGRQTMSAAGESLLLQGRSQRLAGELAQASASLERAIRIQPGQAEIWLELARVRLLEGNRDQAVQLARKALSLAPEHSAVAEQSLELIAEAS